jgi:hypothetical protein
LTQDWTVEAEGGLCYEGCPRLLEERRGVIGMIQSLTRQGFGPFDPCQTLRAIPNEWELCPDPSPETLGISVGVLDAELQLLLQSFVGVWTALKGDGVVSGGQAPQKARTTSDGLTVNRAYQFGP